MPWLILLALAALAALTVLAAGCGNNDHLIEQAQGGPHTVTRPSDHPDEQPEPDGPVDGGVIDSSDPDAPKQIESKTLILFDCRFSTMDSAEPGSLGNHIYELEASLENGAVKAAYRVADTGEERLFRESHEFLAELRSLIETYDLAQHNGHAYTVAGIPGDYGARLDARYASGESIYASDNQDNFLSWGAMNALVRLFERGASVTPVKLSFAVETRYESELLADGSGEMQYPVYRLDEKSYPALSAAIDALNETRLADAADEMEAFRSEGRGQLCHRTDTFVTRSDSEVVSFYERTERYEDAGWELPMTECRTHNLDARTGKELKFSDVFRDMAYLPSLLLSEFERAYPEQTFYGDALDFIRQSVEGDDGNISFALGYGFVHVFADEYILNDEPGGQHITLSYVLNPDQVRAFYATAPNRWLIPMDYDTVYWRNDVGVGFRMRSFEMPGSDGVRWAVTIEGGEAGPYEETFSAHAPACWLARINGRDFIYLRVPAGDMSMRTKILEVTQRAVSKRTYDTAELAIRADTPLNPDILQMYLNAPISSSVMTLLPCGTFRVETNGLPEPVEDVYRLDGPQVLLREGGRYNAIGAEAVASGGMWTLVAGERLRPYQTDMNCFLDFITEDGRVVRFSIDKWGDDMRLDNFGTLENVFSAESGGRTP